MIIHRNHYTNPWQGLKIAVHHLSGRAWAILSRRKCEKSQDPWQNEETLSRGWIVLCKIHYFTCERKTVRLTYESLYIYTFKAPQNRNHYPVGLLNFSYLFALYCFYLFDARVLTILTSLSFHSPGMQKDSSRSLPHRSRIRNSIKHSMIKSQSVTQLV